MANKVTRCPKCKTSFRISDPQLQSAKGSVRCGSCLHIFKALDHLVSVPSNSAKKTSAAPKTKLKAKPEVDDDDILISDDMVFDDDQEQERFSDEFTQTVGSSTSVDDNLFERGLLDDEDENGGQSDESWALDLLEDENRETKEELIEPSKRIPPKAPEPEPEEDFANSFQLVDEDPIDEVEQDLLAQLEEFETTDEHYEDINYSEFETPQSTSNRFLDAIEPEPVEFAWKTHTNLWQSKWLWGSLCFFAGILLLIQIAWINFDTFSRVDTYRGYYASACKIIGCKLPEVSDHDKISATNLIVRAHPKQENALIVDFVIQNSARFSQPFPAIELIFTNKKAKVLAARCFAPNDYLGGELKGRKNMPVRQPIHIALEVMHPGDDALGYKIGICD